AQYPFTLAYVNYTWGDGERTGHVVRTMVVLQLRYAYAESELLRRKGWGVMGRRDGIGHAEFDRRYRVRTDVPGGARAVVSPELIASQLAGELPSWRVCERELLCSVDGQQKVALFDRDLSRALRVAQLLQVR